MTTSSVRSRSLFSGRSMPVAFMIGLGIGASALVGWQAGASAPVRVAPEPARIATINLEKLVEKLDEVKERDASVKARGMQRQEELNSLTQELQKIETDINSLPRESKERREKVAKGLELKQLADTKLRVYQQLINFEKGEILADIYKKIVATAGQIAERDGYDAVLMDDRVIQIPDSASDAEINQVIQAKRLLWARESLDITDRVATVMNSERNAPARK